ncbi:MAG TPA: sigma-54-dependent Fis family transcriptional regulator [Gemmataceae bacterium]|nr:sigma-54-dependent Fis family transcriptional regulator [Gemmataceae bacterium]
MTTPVWLRPADCALLHGDADAVDSVALRLVQRLLEIPLNKQGSEALAKAALEEIASAVRAEQVAILEATPQWAPRWLYSRRPARGNDNWPKPLLGEVLDREAAVAVPPGGNAAGSPALLAVCLGYRERANRALVIARPGEEFQRLELEYGLTAGYYLGLALEAARIFDEQKEGHERLQALVAIGQQLVEQRETVPLLEHIAEQAVKLLRCERASIFLWDQARKELVGRPALGLPNGELRLADDVGVVGKVLRSGEPEQVDDVRADADWNSKVDTQSGFQTRSLLCVPMVDAAGTRVGVFEVMNKKTGKFSQADVETLRALASQTTAAVQNVRERESLMRSNAEHEGQARKGALIIGESTAIKALRETIERVARTDLPVLILGESGTGKDVVARAIHYSSSRHQQPFIPVNCAAIAETLLESELFGHEKGAFTDARETRAGKFEAASGGTLFLDEIGDLSAGGQAKLLRVLEEKVVFRVGGHQPIPVDTRIVAATNRNLAESVRAGKFREDLFYRLTVVTLDLPALRERRDDILVLAEHFLKQFFRDAGRKPLKMTAEAKRKLEQHNWPGNVRELRNLLERVAYLCAGDKVDVADLAIIVRPSGSAAESDYADLTLKDATDKFQHDHIQRAIERTGKNISDAAKLLGLHRPNLYRKMRDLGMET